MKKSFYSLDLLPLDPDPKIKKKNDDYGRETLPFVISTILHIASRVDAEYVTPMKTEH